MRRRTFLFVVLLVLPALGQASNYVCGDTTKLGYYAQGVDPSNIPPCAPPFTVDTAGVPEAQIPAQTTLYNTVGRRHLKVIDGLMVEMSQAEKDAVDLPGQQQAAATAVAKQEMATNEVCANNTLPDIDAYWDNKQSQLQAAMGEWQTAINALPGGGPKTAMEKSYAAVFAHMTMFIENEKRQWRSICSHQYVRP